MDYDGAVRVNTAFDAEAFNKGVDRMEKAMSSLAGRIERLGATIDKAFSGYVRTLQNAGAAMRPVEASTEAAAEKTERLDEAVNGAAEAYGKAAREADAAKTAMSGVGDAGNLDALSGMFEDFRRQISELESAYREMLSSGGEIDAAQLSDFEAQLDSLRDDFKALGEITSENAGLMGLDDFRSLDEAELRLQQLSEGFEKVSQNSAQMAEPVSEIVNPLDEATQEAQTLSENFDGVRAEIENAKEAAESANTAMTELMVKPSLENFDAAMEAVREMQAAYADLENAMADASGAEGFSEIAAEAEPLLDWIDELSAAFDSLREHIQLEGLSYLVSEIDDSESALEGYQEQVAELSELDAGYGEWTELSGEIADVAAEAERLQAELDALAESGDVDQTQYDELSERLSALIGDYDELSSAAEEAAQEAKPQYLEDWENAPTLTGEIEEYFRRIANAAKFAALAMSDPVGAMDRFLGAVAQSAERASAALAQMTRTNIINGFRLISESASEAARSIARMTATAVSGGIKRLGVWLSSAAKSMTLFGRSARKNNDILKKSFSTILKYGLGVRSFYYLFRKIRAAIKEGFQNLARYSDALNESISGVISSFKRFENQFAASFEPLVNTIAPAITNLINSLTEGTYRVGEFIAALSGQKTVTKAKEVQEDYAASLDKTKEAAKEAERQLAGFDKLNILKKPDESEEAKPEDMFETIPVEDEAKDFADAFKEAWVNVDLTGIGEIVGGKIKAALDKIPWPDIKQGAENMGKRLATFLNGLINVLDLGKSIGKSIAEAINTAFSYLDGFAWTFKWRGLGDAIMDTVEAACDNLDWARINHALQGLAIGLADLLNTIFSRVEVWEKVGRTIGKAINAAVLFGLTFLERFDFNQAARAIVAGLNAAVAEIRFDNIGQLLGDALGGALQFLYTAATEFSWVKLGNQLAIGVNAFTSTVRRRIYDLQWADVGAAIADGFNTAIIGIEWGGVGETAGMLFGGALTVVASFIRDLDYGEILQAIQDFFSGALQQIDWYDFLTVWGVAALLIALKSVIAAHPVLAALTLAVLALGPELGKVIDKMIADIPWAEVGQTISNALIGALNRLHEAITSADWFALGQAVGESLGNINWSEIVNSVVRALEDLIIAGIETLAGVIVGMGPEGIINVLWAVVKAIAAYIAFGSLFSMISGAVGTLFSGVGLLITGGIEGLTLLATGAISLLGTAITGAISLLGTAITGAISLLGTAITVAGGPLATLLGGVITAVLAVGDAFLLIYDIFALDKAADDYNAAMEAHNKETETALDTLTKLYNEKGAEVAAEWAKTCYDIDITGKSLDEAQTALTDKIDSLWDDVPQNMWDGFKQGWSYYFGENGKGLSALLGDTFTTAVKFVKEGVLGEHSPSTVFDDMGQNSALGYTQGFQTRWPELTSFFTTAFGGMKEKFTDAWKGIESDAAKNWTSIKSALSKKAAEIKTDVTGKLRELAASVKTQWGGMKNTAVSDWNSIKTSVVSAAQTTRGQVVSAFQSMQGTLSGVWSGIRSAASGAMASVSSTVSSMASSISSRVSSIRSTVSNITSAASDALSRVADKMDGLTRKTANSVGVGGLASGGFVPDGGRVRSWYDTVRKYASGTSRAMGSLFVAGEAGPEIVGHVNGRTEVLNQSQIAGAIYGAVLDAMSEAVKTFGGFLSQQLATNTNALITAIGQLQAPREIAAPQDTALTERLAALSAIPYQVPAYATGTVMPYEVVAEIRRQTSEITSAICDNGQIVISAVASAISNHGLAVTDAIGKIPVNHGQNYSPDDMAQYTVDYINRQTRMMGKSPLRG